MRCFACTADGATMKRPLRNFLDDVNKNGMAFLYKGYGMSVCLQRNRSGNIK